MPESAEVLNGIVSKGDRVAYATREGNTAAIHLGVVEEIGARKKQERDETEPVIKVRIECESRQAHGSLETLRTVGILDRVVKI